MKKSVILSLAVAFILPQVVKADEPVVLTPTKLYDMIQENRKNIQCDCEHFSAVDTDLQKAVSELQRKVKGMQKQITILHSKKADKR